MVSSLLMMQPDIGQSLLVIFSWGILIFVSGISLLFLSILLFVLATCCFLLDNVYSQSLNILKIE